MINIESKYSFSVGMRISYKDDFTADSEDTAALHKYILSLVYGCQFIDENGKVNLLQIEELVTFLEYAVNKDDAQPYECLLYFELCRALKRFGKIEAWHNDRPEYIKYCALSELSYEILAHTGFFDEAAICGQDLVNVGIFDNEKLICIRAELYNRSGDKEGAYQFLKERVCKANFYLSPTTMSHLLKSATEIGKEEDLLEFFRAGVQENKYVKWVSRQYITLCVAQGLIDEAYKELDRLKGIVEYTYSDGIITHSNQGLIKYYANVRKILGLPHSLSDVVKEFGYLRETDTTDTNNVSIEFSRGRNRSKPKSPVGSSPWDNGYYLQGTKALIRRINKMNKPFRTFFKLFDGGEKDLIHAKCILGNYVSIIKNRFNRLFNVSNFEVVDYALFYDMFPFYGLNGFTEEEVDEVVTLLKRIEEFTTQLNPFVSSRSFPVNSMLDDLLSVNTVIEVGTKSYQYSISEKGQLTLFGSILLISTFLYNYEKESFAFELAGSDTKLSQALLKQIFNTIPSVQFKDIECSTFSDAERERNIFSLQVRKEIFRFLMELERSILKSNQLLSAELPNANCMRFRDMLSLKYTNDSIIYGNLLALRETAVIGALLGSLEGRNTFSISGVVKILGACRDEDPSTKLFQTSIESLFIICANRKYYNQLKWCRRRTQGLFLKNKNTYCKKMLFRNSELMTEEDESALFLESRERLFTHTDDVQNKEFYSYFGSEGFEWAKIEIVMYQTDSSKGHFVINGEETDDEYCMIYEDDNLVIAELSGYQFVGWDFQTVFDSPMARHVLKKAIYSRKTV